MKKSVRVGLIAAGIVAVVGVVGFWALDRMMKQPLYAVGAVRNAVNLRAPLQPPAQADSSAWQVEPDIRLHFETRGEGQPVLIVHGGPGIPYADAWQGLEPLTDRYAFHYYHMRGCGESSRPFDRFASSNFYTNMTTLERALGLGAQIADIERIRQILSQDKLILIGHSFGGFVAALYAAEFPERVDKLVLVAPAGVLTPPDEERNLFSQTRAKLPQAKHAGYDSLLAAYLDFGNLFSKSEAELSALNERMGEYILPAMGYEPLPAAATPRSGGWAVYAMFFSMGRAQDYRPAMASITAPTLIVLGTDDELAAAGTRSYREAMPAARFVEISADLRVGHFVFDDNPEKFAAVVGSFLEGQ